MAKPVSVSTICKYAKSRLGYGSRQFYSPYQLGCMALEIDGLPQPSGVTYQKWCYKNIEHISSEAAKYREPVAEKPRAVKRVKKTHVATDALEITNLQILCHECNHGKGNWDQTDWRR